MAHMMCLYRGRSYCCKAQLHLQSHSTTSSGGRKVWRTTSASRNRSCCFKPRLHLQNQDTASSGGRKDWHTRCARIEIAPVASSHHCICKITTRPHQEDERVGALDHDTTSSGGRQDWRTPLTCLELEHTVPMSKAQSRRGVVVES